MQLYRCNRCKREIYSPSCTYESKVSDLSHIGRGDLCLNCYKDFMKWLDEGVSTDTDVSKTQNENNVKGEVFSCIPYEMYDIKDVPACFKAAFKYMSIEYYGESSSEVDILLDLLNEFANKYEDIKLLRIVNSYSTGLKYNFITNEEIYD